MLGIVGKKLGMTQVFEEDGTCIPVTVVEALPTKIMGIRTADKNGYSAVQVAAGKVKEKHRGKAVLGQFKKAGVEPARVVREFRIDDTSSFEVGQDHGVNVFDGVKRVTVTSKSKGRGFAGTIKRYGFSRGPTTHGSKNKRAPGSLGAHSYPARVFPGKKLPGHMGDAQVTVKNLTLVKVDAEKNLLFIRGAVPGATNAQVIVRKQ